MKVGSCLQFNEIEKIYKKLAMKGLNIISTEEINIPSLKSANMNTRTISLYETQGKKLALRIKNENNGNPVFYEMSWYMKIDNSKHAMALIYFPDTNIVEFFDPSGYKHIYPSLTTYSADKVIYYVLDSCIKTLDATFHNMNELNINPGGHCNAWSIYYCMMRSNDMLLNFSTFQKKYINQWQKINTSENKFQLEYEIYGPIHKLLKSMV